MGPQSLRRASSMELVPDVPLRMKHPALPLLVSGLNEIAVVIIPTYYVINKVRLILCISS